VVAVRPFLGPSVETGRVDLMQLGADLVTGMQMVRQLLAVLMRSLTLLDCRGDRCRVEASTTATAPGQAEPAGAIGPIASPCRSRVSRRPGAGPLSGDSLFSAPRTPSPLEHGHAQLAAWLVGGALAGKSVDSCTERAQRGA